MTRAIALSVLAIFACGVAQATSYEWSAGTNTKNYDDSSAWTPTGVPGAGDSLHMGGVGNKGTVQFNYATQMNIGSVTIDNGTVTHGGTGTMVVAGDLLVQNSGLFYGNGSRSTLDIGGNFKAVAGGSYATVWEDLIMRGSGVSLDYRFDSGDQWHSVTIAPGASVSTAATNVSGVAVLNVNGTISGIWSIYTDPNATTGISASGVSFGAGGAWTSGELRIVHQMGTSTDNTSIGAGTYPALTILDTGGSTSIATRNIRLKGNVTITNDFNYGRTFAGWITDDRTLFNTDNGTGKISNLTVNGNLRIGENHATQGSPNDREYSGFAANSATINIAGSATFDYYSYIKGGTSTWNVGGNVLFTTNYRYDNSSLTGTTFTVNGTGAQSLDFGQSIPAGKKLPLGNLVINKLHGVAALADNVLLTGNFRLQSGGLSNTGNYWINMQGGQGTWAGAETFENDNSSVNIRRLYVKQGSPTWVKLNSNLAISDNLAVDPNCILFTNGFTLTVTGGLDKGTFGPSSAAYQTREGGFILITGVPEPATLALAGTGALGLFAWMRRRRTK